MFAEEGINGAHQDPQYNVLYRNINMVRSFVDACESKKILAWADIAQIDGAHNANATAREAWKVMPELIVQHAINSLFSEKSRYKVVKYLSYRQYRRQRLLLHAYTYGPSICSSTT